MTQYVKIYYGPNESFGVVCHRPQKLYGLRDALRKDRFRVNMVPVKYRNYCMIEMSGHEIFRCNIGNFSFNTPCELDPVCQRALIAVKEASIKTLRARQYFWTWGLIEELVFTNNEYGPKNYWPKDIELKPLASCADCVHCCGVLARIDK